MEHTYQSPMMLPAAYAVLSEDEMIYIEGGEFSFAVGDHTVTVRPEILAQQVAYYTTNIIINGMYLLGQGYVQQVTRTLITGLSDGLTLGGTIAHSWNKLNGWSKAGSIGLSALGGLYIYVQIATLAQGIQDLLGAISGSSSNTTDTQSAENGLLIA